uniref:GC-rich sequence DNA-binding factor 1 n=1 Tax=Ascaris suum TaxID=6253 RepID=F1KUT3_ASCSU
MFRKSKSRSNLRQRLRSIDEDESKDEKSTPTNGISTTAKEIPEKVINSEGIESTVVNTKPNSLLSFDDVEGDDVTDFKLRKKDQNKRTEKLSKKAKTLRKKDLEGHLSDEEQQTSVVSDRIKKEVSPSDSSSHDSHNNSDKASMEKVKEETPSKEKNNFEDETIRSKFPTTFGQIPDAQAVYEARKKREKMRMSGFDGRIPLDDVQKLKDKSVAHSRLIREDDNDMSDEDDEAGRFYSSKTLVLNEEERRRSEHSQFLAIEQGDEENEHSDEELSRWESEQMKKGVSSYKVELLERERKRMAEMMRAMMVGGAYTAPDENNEPQPMDVEMDIDMDIREPEVTHAGQVSGKTSNVTLDGILSKLRLRIKDREEALNTREAELEKVERNIAENKETMAKLQMDEPRLEELFTMYQEIRAYSRDLLECLSEKVDEIKNLEGKVFSVVNGRAQRLRRRRRQDVHDVYDECSAAAAGKNINAMRAPNVTQRAAEREARRARRRRNRENTLEGVAHDDGLSSDDEETNSEIAATQLVIKEVTEAARLVFVDALDDFCHIDKILSRFVDWLALDETSFTDAYIQLCIPKLLSPFIRLEIIDWNPLESDDRPLHTMRWYEDLLSCGSSNAGLNSEHEMIVSLIPLCIERIIIPRIADMVQEQWDPLSQKQCSRLGFLLSSLVDECPTLVPSSRSVKRLLEAIRQRVQESIDEDLFVPIYSKQAVENASTGCRVFLDRQFWNAVKLMRCVNSLSSTLSEECMKELLVDGIMRRSITLALQCSMWNDASILRKCKAAVKAIPTDWWHKYSGSLKTLISVLQRITHEHLSNKNRELAKEIRRTIGLEK